MTSKSVKSNRKEDATLEAIWRLEAITMVLEQHRKVLARVQNIIWYA